MGATSILINLANLTNNLKCIKEEINQETKIMAVVKADAYGHGAVQVSKHLLTQGVDYLAVTNLQEGLELRKAGIEKPILIIALVDSTEYLQCLQNELMLTVCSYQQLQELEKLVEESSLKAKIVLKIDTGMNRIGIKAAEAEAYAQYIVKRSAKFDFKGVVTHLASADAGLNEITKQQLERFKQAVEGILKYQKSLEIISIANSAGIFILKPLYGNTVRVGIALYGLKPDEFIPADLEGLKPALSFTSKVLFIKKIGSGEKIGYAGTFTTAAATNIATIPVGYADGYPRNLSNKAVVAIKDKYYPIVGNICMSTLMVDLGENLAEITVGERVELISTQPAGPISLEFLAKQAGLISYELLCALKAPRTYS